VDPPVGPGRRPSQLAVGSIVAAIAQVFLPVLAAIVAIVTGHLARRRIRRDPTLRGGGLALAGITLGYAGIALIAGAIGLFVYSGVHSSHVTMRRIDGAVAEAHLTSLGTVVADQRSNTGVNIDTHPTREILLSTPGSATELGGTVERALAGAGFFREGATTWRRDAGGFLDAEVFVFPSNLRTAHIGSRKVVLPRDRGVVQIRIYG
jgi:hypothetical protein